jgi:hypothetical protein
MEVHQRKRPVRSPNLKAETPWGPTTALLLVPDSLKSYRWLVPLGLLHRADVGVGVKTNSSSSRAPDRPAQRS